MIFFEFSCFFDDPVDVGSLISGSSAFSKSSLNIWKFTVHVLLKPGLENFEHYSASVWDECNCVVVWTFFGIALLWDWNKNLSGAARMCPGRDKVTGRERNLQGSSSPRGCPGGPVCPFAPSVSLLLGFLLIFGNIIYGNKASLEKSKLFWKCSWLLWLGTRP